jgi:hypothetical protein
MIPVSLGFETTTNTRSNLVGITGASIIAVSGAITVAVSIGHAAAALAK